MLHPLLAATGTSKTGTRTQTTTTGANYTLPIMLGVLALAYFLFLRPRSQKMKQQQAEARRAEVGDEVMLTSGIIGTVTWIAGNRARVEVAPGTELLVDKAAILRKIVEPVSDEEIALAADDSHLSDNPYQESEHADLPLVSGSGPAATPATSPPASTLGPTGLGQTGLGDMGTGPSTGGNP
jgi:preprotein translocase subunit YajC